MSLINTAFTPQRQELFLLDGEGILFCFRTSRLFYLNTTAAFLWCCFEEGRTPPSAAAALSEKFGVSLYRAQEDVESLIEEWRSSGLVGDSLADVSESSRHEPKSRPDNPSTPCTASGSLSKQEGNGHRPPQIPEMSECVDSLAIRYATGTISDDLAYNYRVGNLHLRICFPSARCASLVHPVFAHLSTDENTVADIYPVSLEISETVGTFSLHRNEMLRADYVSENELASVVQREILVTAFESSGCLIGIHAAAISKGNRCLVMPAVPGSGKTTLTAALVSSGCTYLTDELVLLMPDSHSARPIPVSMGLKRGSWPLLEPLFPAVRGLRIFRQPDGTEVRYLPPEASQLPDHDEYPVQRLVFPVHVDSGPTGLERLTSAKALYRLAEAGYAVPGKLELPVVTELIAWIRHMDCYELRVRDLTAAVRELDDLLA